MSIVARIRRMRVGRVFSTTTHPGTEWWLRVPRGYRVIADWRGRPWADSDQVFYPIDDDDWSRDVHMIALSEDESARFLAILAMTRALPAEYM